ncbi:dipeptide/oligopeptide/nickel ABC transporter permease/ATP-binding protein [Aquibium carbonis]|uniref:Dipeptide/oligopeptide/nickel ABC transporter permease/ATP-binding protein n=1 Tax=Aquibium carbonis TaxID=2495581 RepID=A0A429YT67_9HYPH|nr:dipeptide/oligopeptide/nickel ABC transporter permease/ATP-binding protein [Aquibium carbonis]RST84653.1 dipeptide/oligopeptide/nickel ABC transporter permease/ATP-binding protein [Aquibium carbonis]
MTPSRPSPSSTGTRFARQWLTGSSLIVTMAVMILVLLVLLALFADVVAPYDPLKQNLMAALQWPSSRHWLGTDDLGRDVLSRLIHGCRIAVIAAAEGTAIAVLLGVPLGLFIGYRGGWWDWIVMRMVEAIVSIPGIMVAIVIIALLGPGLHKAMIALGILYSTSFLRLARGVVLAEREEVYVRSARVIGASDSRILLRHIVPNIAPPLIVQITLTVGAVLLSEAGLSFIGLGVQPPDASWGTMLNSAAAFMDLNWFLAIPPGIAIILTVLAVNLIGDVIRDGIGRGIAAEPRADVAAARSAAVEPTAATEAAALPRVENEVLRVENLQVVVGTGVGVPIITDLSFGIARGETLGLVGESGSGKTMTGLAILRLMGGGLRTTHGSITLDGRDLRSLSDRQMEQVRGNAVSMVFQDPTTSLNPAFTVGNQIAEVLRAKQGLSRAQAWSRTVELLDRVGIPRPEERARAYPHELSGGMAQRVAIARALSCNPSLLIADEPTTALDVTVQQEILDLFRDLQDEFGMAILFVTHDLAVAADICDRIAVMYAGEMVETAKVDALFSSPRHPYTRGLLAAMPHASDRNPPLPTIRGNVPRPGAWPAGCRFSNRCDFRTARCEQRIPLTGRDRLVRCVRADELALEAAQ